MGRTFVAPGIIRVDSATVWNQYVFAWDGSTNGNIYGYKYYDGTYAATRGSVAITGDMNVEGVWTCILSDSSGLVGEGSLFAFDATDGIKVWDVEGGVLYELSLANSYWAPIYRNGKVWWVENDGAGNFELHSANTDLTGDTTVSTVAHGLGFIVAGGWSYNSSALFMESSNFPYTDIKRFRFPFNGDPVTSASIASETSPMAAVGGFTRSDGKPAFIGGSSLRLCVLDSDSESASVSEVWPDFGLSSLSGTVASLSQDGTVVQLYNASDGGANRGFRDAASGTFGASPRVSFVLGASPDSIVGSSYTAAFFVS